MVRTKRLRRFKIKVVAAAGLLALTAVILLSVIIIFNFKGKAGKAEKDDALEVLAKEGGESAEEEVSRQEMPDKSAVENEAAPSDPPDEKVLSPEDEPPEKLPPADDDSNQDAHSSVSDEKVPFEESEKVYITFDDGPSIYTGTILDTLASYGVKATFFVCGTGDRAEELRPLYKRIVEEGHSIGMHSYSHVYSRVYGSLDGFQEDLDKIRNLIYNETGVAPKFYRFPGGSGNTVAKLPMWEYISVLYSQAMEYYDWNVYAGDASGKSLSKDVIVRNTLSGVDRRKTAVILLHDTANRKTTVEALPEIIEGLKERGVEILAIDEDTPPLHQFELEEE